MASQRSAEHTHPISRSLRHASVISKLGHFACAMNHHGSTIDFDLVGLMDPAAFGHYIPAPYRCHHAAADPTLGAISTDFAAFWTGCSRSLSLFACGISGRWSHWPRCICWSRSRCHRVWSHLRKRSHGTGHLSLACCSSTSLHRSMDCMARSCQIEGSLNSLSFLIQYKHAEFWR